MSEVLESLISAKKVTLEPYEEILSPYVFRLKRSSKTSYLAFCPIDGSDDREGEYTMIAWIFVYSTHFMNRPFLYFPFPRASQPDEIYEWNFFFFYTHKKTGKAQPVDIMGTWYHTHKRKIIYELQAPKTYLVWFTDKLIQTIDEHKKLLSAYTAAYVPEEVWKEGLRIKPQLYNLATFTQSIVSEVFAIEQKHHSDLVKKIKYCSKEFKEKVDEMNRAKGYHDLVKNILSEPNSNFINMSTPLAWNTPEFVEGLREMTPSPDDPFGVSPEIYRAAVLWINNVMAVHPGSGGSFTFLIKLRKKDALIVDPEEDGMITEVIQYKNEGASQFFQQFRFEGHVLTEEGFEEDEDIKPRQHNWFDLWKRHPDRALVHTLVFNPWPVNQPPSPTGGVDDSVAYANNRALNLFSGWGYSWGEIEKIWTEEPEHCKKCIEIFERLIRSVFTRTQQEGDFFIKWLACILQRPMEKTKVLTVIKGQKGLGKGCLSRIMQKICSRHFFFLNGTNPFEKFNSFLSQKKMAWIDELPDLNRNDQVLKSMTTESTMNIEPKGVDRRSEINLIEVIGCTNSEIRLPTSEDERRYFITECKEFTPEQLQKYKEDFAKNSWAPLLEEKNGIGVAAIFHHLMNIDLKGFKPWKEIPRTEYLNKMITNSLPVPVDWWRNVINRKGITYSHSTGSHLDFAGVSYTWSTLYQAFKTDELYAQSKGKHKIIHVTESDFKSALSCLVAKTATTGKRFELHTLKDQVAQWKVYHPTISLSCEVDTTLEIETVVPEIFKLPLPNKVKNWNLQQTNAFMSSISSTLDKLGFKIKFKDPNATGKPVATESDLFEVKTGDRYCLASKRGKLARYMMASDEVLERLQIYEEDDEERGRKRQRTGE